MKKDANLVSLDLHKPLPHPLLLADKTGHLLKPFLVLDDKHQIRPWLLHRGVIAALPRAPNRQLAQPRRLPPLPSFLLLLLAVSPGLCLTPTTHQCSFLLVAESILLLNSFPQCCLLWLFHLSPVICTQTF